MMVRGNVEKEKDESIGLSVDNKEMENGVRAI